MDETAEASDFTFLTADVVSAYVAKNSVRPADLPDLIASVHGALQGLTVQPQAEPEKREPAVSVKKSMTPDFLISLEDGKRYKTLKRHLNGRGLTPEQYREKWGLPSSYPKVASNYAKRRSELATASGLGQLRRKEAVAIGGGEASAPVPDPVDVEGQEAEPPKRRGRPRTKAAA